MGRKRQHVEASESDPMPKKAKIEISGDANEEFKEVMEGQGTLYKKGKKKKDKSKQERNEGDDYNEETSGFHARKSQVPIRRKARGMDLSRAKEILHFEEARNLILTNPKCGLKAVREKRHVTLPYHLIGGNILRSCEFLAKMTVGKYRPKVGGVVISIGSVRLASLPRIIDDQGVFHLEMLVTQAVFRPTVRKSYEARVTHIAEDFISALILESISISTPVDEKFRDNLKGIVLEVDDIIEVKHRCLTIKRGICQLKGKFVRVLRKGNTNKGGNNDFNLSAKKSMQRKTFVDEDEEK